MSYAAAVPTAAPTAARRWAWIAVLVVGTALFLAVERTLVATRNPNFVPSAILLGAAIVPAAFLTFVYGRRLNYDVGLPVVASAAFLGGVIGTVVAGTRPKASQAAWCCRDQLLGVRTGQRRGRRWACRTSACSW
jgi:RsiW-degrading membrane proteinase PrsW (M82 family)